MGKNDIKVLAKVIRSTVKEQLSYKIKTNHSLEIVSKVLFNMSWHVVSKRLPQTCFTAICGPTGCGKSLYMSKMIVDDKESEKYHIPTNLLYKGRELNQLKQVLHELEKNKRNVTIYMDDFPLHLLNETVEFINKLKCSGVNFVFTSQCPDDVDMQDLPIHKLLIFNHYRKSKTAYKGIACEQARKINRTFDQDVDDLGKYEVKEISLM